MGDPRQLNLFSNEIDLRIEKIAADDVKRLSDKYIQFKKLILKHEKMYPGIGNWFKNKVIPGLKAGERISYIGFRNEVPIVSSVVRLGRDAKFCHLHIENNSQNSRFGDLFFSMMAVDVRSQADSVHFTLPEALWHNKKGFFNSFGFMDIKKASIQYRSFEEELQTSTLHRILWEKMLEKLPRVISYLTPSNKDIFTGLLMSVKPEFIEKIGSGEKIVEIRKRFNSKWNNCRVTLYSTSPSQALYGHVNISGIQKGHPDVIWGQFKSDIGCTEKEYEEYTKNTDRIYAIKLDDFQPYRSPLIIEQLEYLLKKGLRPPQSYLCLQNSSDWSEAVSIAELLHRRFKFYISSI